MSESNNAVPLFSNDWIESVLVRAYAKMQWKDAIVVNLSPAMHYRVGGIMEAILRGNDYLRHCHELRAARRCIAARS